VTAPDSPSPAPALAQAAWCGDPAVLPIGAEVDVLGVDAAGRLSRHDGLQGVPARTACWIRWWPEAREHARFRSCDLADLDLSDEDWERLLGITNRPELERVLRIMAEVLAHPADRYGIKPDEGVNWEPAASRARD